MFLGHYGVALAAKRATRSAPVSLGVLTFAAQWLDELWPVLLLAGVEQVRIVAGLTAANPLDFVSYPISHSLVTAVLWGGLVGGAYFLRCRDRRAASIVGALVVSHWLLDLPMHIPDLPLWPGSGAPRVGLGAWRSLGISIAIELLVFGIGLISYLRATRPIDRIGRWGTAGMVFTLLLIYIGGIIGPPPPDARTIAVSALVLWLFIPWSWWIDRHREVVR